MTAPFDFRAVPLSGTHLIEASAGTGKTYAVAGLYVRLVVEAGLSVDQILVVTFTDAATQELRDRLYARLGEARVALDGPAGPPPGLPPGVTPAAARARLDQALTRFDEAAVFTIHGFCQRSLSDAAFECGAPFDAEVQGDEGELLQQVADDFWRREFDAVTPLAAEFVVEKKLSPETLLADVRRHLNRPYLKVRVPPEDDTATTAALEEDYLVAFRDAQGLWRRHAEELAGHLAAPGLNRTSYKPEQLLTLLAALDDFFAGGAALTLPAKFELATQAKLKGATKNGHATPEHPFFAACDTLAAAQARLLARFQADLARRRGRLMDYASAELARRKRELGRLSYDDLLLNLHAALHGDGGGALIRVLRARYRAALIDEFQDTDPLQYAIFRRAFATPVPAAATGASDGPGDEPGNELGGGPAPLFFVGDPKQAIYGFRGADVFAYLQGRRDAAHTHTLAVNWRSHPRLIRAVNAWFGGAQPFLLEQIAFAPAQPCPAPHAELVVEGDGSAPFRVWLETDSSTQAGDSGRQAGGEDGKKAKKDPKAVHEARAARATAAEVARLLGLAAQGRARLGDRPLEGSDIAVLVRSHQQARLIRRALMDAGVASAELGQDSVFASREAASLQTLLAALARPGDEGRVRAALGDELLGRTADELYAFASPDGPGDQPSDQPGGEPSDQPGGESGEGSWWAAVDAFRRAHELWAAHGLMRAFRELCREFQVYPRLLAYRDGERRLTNLLHLVELLHRHAGEWHGTAGGAAAWLAARRDGQTTEAQELRLESDERVVRVVTVHKSKGLEYAVVFCPFLAQGKKPPACLEDSTASRPVSAYFHDPEDGYGGVLDLGSEDWQRAARLEHTESRAEELRLAYVALTRARCRCYVVWGAAGGAEHSPLAWLAGGRSPAEIADDCDGEVEVRPLAEVGADASPPAPDPEPECHARPFRSRIPEAWRVTSFSALNAGGAAHEAMDTEAVDTAHASDAGEGGPEFDSELGPELGPELGSTGAWPGGPDAAGLDAGVNVGPGRGFDPGFAPGDLRSLGRVGGFVPSGIPAPLGWPIPVGNTAPGVVSPASGRNAASEGGPAPGHGRLAAVTLPGANARHPDPEMTGAPPSGGARGPAAGPDDFLNPPLGGVALPPTAPPEFPRGAEAGTCLHAVFEKLDFSVPDDLDARTAEALAAFGIEPRWRPAARRLVQNTLAAPLAPGLRLGALPWSKTVRELEFVHPIARISPEGLAAVLAAHGRGAGGRLESLGFEPVRGYLRGFVDLVFEHDGRYYLADYKSNWLGPRPADYHAAAMRREMRAAGYELQLLIYTVALHRHLRRRLPDYAYDRHFGGAYYLFLRGLGSPGDSQPAKLPTQQPRSAAPRHGCGVHFDRPDFALVTALDEYFSGGAQPAG